MPLHVYSCQTALVLHCTSLRRKLYDQLSMGCCWCAEDTGLLSAQVPLLNRIDSQHQAPLTDLAEWLSQNLQDDLQGDAMVSSPTHPSRWGPLAPAGIVESKPP